MMNFDCKKVKLRKHKVNTKLRKHKVKKTEKFIEVIY